VNIESRAKAFTRKHLHRGRGRKAAAREQTARETLTISPAGAPRRSSPVCKHPDSHNRVDATPAQHHDFLLDFVGIMREIETF